VVHPPPDPVVAGIAAAQHGVVTVAQLAAAGVGRRGVAHRVAHGRLTRLHRGVYRVGPLEAPLTAVMAAVLAYGPRAVASHRTAAALHGFAAAAACVDVTVPAGHPRRRPGVRIHRSPLDGDVTTARGVPVTSVERTIRDLAGRISDRELRRTIEEALIQRKLDHSSLTDAVTRARGRRGAAALRAAADAVAGRDDVTRSEAERRLLGLIRDARLPPPQTNARVGRYEVDALWRRERLVAEVDGFAFHGHRGAFERDRRRDADLAAGGFRVIRVTWRQLTDEPEAVVARLAAALVR
jgi:very-short-patch-repair endonuclease